MKKIIYLIIFVFCLVSVSAHVCQDEEVPNSDCKIISPGNMTCDEYWVYDETGVLADSGTMTLLFLEGNIYYFTFTPSAIQSYVIHLCDGSTGYLKIGNTLFQEVDNVEENQATIQSHLLNINTSLHDEFDDLDLSAITDSLNYINNSLPNATAKAVWNYNISLAPDYLAGDFLEKIWNKLKDSTAGTLISNLLEELSGGYFG